MSEIFWLDNFEGECQGGFFVRNVDMKNHFSKELFCFWLLMKCVGSDQFAKSIERTQNTAKGRNFDPCDLYQKCGK